MDVAPVPDRSHASQGAWFPFFSSLARRTSAVRAGLVTAVIGVLAFAGGVGCTTTTERLHLPPVQTVAKVDIQKYAGMWYEIAAFPLLAERGCTGVTATYKLRDDGEIDVLNRCRQYSLDGPEDSVNGRARVVDTATNAKLQVSFFRPFWGDYWVIDLAPDYSYAVVGHPSRDYLWILSRTPKMNEDVYQGILKRLKEEHKYELDRLVRTPQQEEQIVEVGAKKTAIDSAPPRRPE